MRAANITIAPTIKFTAIIPPISAATVHAINVHRILHTAGAYFDGLFISEPIHVKCIFPFTVITCYYQRYICKAYEITYLCNYFA